MQALREYYASDRRCYDGAFCPDMERELASRQAMRKQLNAVGLVSTYFPAGGYFVGFDRNNGLAVITKDCHSFQECYNLCREYHLTR